MIGEWRVLVYDRAGRDILLPLFSVAKLKNMGITVRVPEKVRKKQFFSCTFCFTRTVSPFPMPRVSISSSRLRTIWSGFIATWRRRCTSPSTFTSFRQSTVRNSKIWLKLPYPVSPFTWFNESSISTRTLFHWKISSLFWDIKIAIKYATTIWTDRTLPKPKCTGQLITLSTDSFRFSLHSAPFLFCYGIYIFYLNFKV